MLNKIQNDEVKKLISIQKIYILCTEYEKLSKKILAQAKSTINERRLWSEF